jgi:hypothetical protein
MNGPGNWAWIISGGDTVVIRGCTASSGQQNPSNPNCRIGNDVAAPGHGSTGFCSGIQPNSSCTNPPIPAGTSGAYTRILGGCAYDSTPGPCSIGTPANNYQDHANLTQLFGGWDVYPTLDLSAAQYVDVEGLELTDHNNCITAGNAGLPSRCVTDGTEDLANSGIYTSNTSGNVTINNLLIHGFPANGIYGSIGGPFTLTNVAVNDNGFAGWNFDNGTGNGPGAAITASYVTMQFNGCNEEYPIVDPIPITYCYDTVSGGFGDAWSGQDATLSNFTGDHLLIRYNTKDAFFGPHTAIGALTITDSTAIGNMGQTWKANLAYSGTMLFQNNLTINNCNRMRAAMTGAPSTFNTYLTQYCRADGAAFAVIWPIAGSFELDGNTFATASVNVGFDFSCTYQLDGATIAAAGTGYQVGDVLILAGTGNTVTVTSVSAGAITGITLTTLGQSIDAPQTISTYLTGGHGTGAQITVTSSTAANCGGGPRILRDNLFYGITDPNGASWNGSTIALFCYSGCQGNPGNSNDTQWTIRSNNLMYAYNANTGQCTYPNEICSSDPLLVNEPPTRVVTEAAYDVFNPTVAGNSFELTASSPAKDKGMALTGLTIDYYGTARPSPPAIGALEYGAHSK